MLICWNCLEWTNNYVYRRRLLISLINRSKKWSIANLRLPLSPPPSELNIFLSGVFSIAGIFFSEQRISKCKYSPNNQWEGILSRFLSSLDFPFFRTQKSRSQPFSIVETFSLYIYLKLDWQPWMISNQKTILCRRAYRLHRTEHVHDSWGFEWYWTPSSHSV